MSIIDRPDVQPAMPTLPASAYRDPAVFERERREILACEWLPFGRSDQLPRLGDSLAATIIGYPVLVVRRRSRRRSSACRKGFPRNMR